MVLYDHRMEISMKVTAFLTDGFETVEALAVIDICRRAGIQIQFQLQVIKML